MSSDVLITVDELIEELKKISADGGGDYAVGCNGEYWLMKYEIEVDHDMKSIDIGGYQ